MDQTAPARGSGTLLKYLVTKGACEELLLNNAGASSARLYWESFDNPSMEPIGMPVSCSIFPREIFRCSKRWAEKRFTNLVYWNELDRGGHFAALEQPELFVQELRAGFRPMR